MTTIDTGGLDGPQGIELANLIDRLRQLRSADVRRIAAIAIAIGESDRMAARVRAIKALTRTTFPETWHKATDAASDAVEHAQRVSGNDQHYLAWARADQAANDAVTGLAARHVIDEDTYRLLTGPVAAVLGPLHPHDNAEEEE